MRIKRFEASTMGGALNMVKREFGPEAVILSARTVNGGSGVLGVLRKPTAVVTAAIDTDGSSAHAVEKKPTLSETLPPGQRENGEIFENELYSGGSKKMSGKDTGSSELLLFENLLAQGAGKDVAERICGLMLKEGLRDGSGGERDMWRMLSEVMDQAGIKVGLFPRSCEGPLVLAMMGPWGAGKTTATAKVAARHSVDLGEKVAIVSMDNQKIAGQEELSGYAGILDIPFRFVPDIHGLQRVIEEFGGYDLVLVDTPGFALARKGDGRDEPDLKGLDLHADPCLVLEATMKGEDLLAAAGSPLGQIARGVIFTRMDQTVSYGNVLTFLAETALPAAYWSHGRRVPMDISEADFGSLARLIMGHGIDFMSSPKNPAGAAKPSLSGRFSGKARSRGYVGNRGSDTFHRQDCQFAARIGKKNRLRFARRADAEANGYRPCGVCIPGVQEGQEKVTEISFEKNSRRMAG